MDGIRLRRLGARIVTGGLAGWLLLVGATFCVAQTESSGTLAERRGSRSWGRRSAEGVEPRFGTSRDERFGMSREERQQRSRERYARRIDPTGQPSVTRLDLYLERYRAINVYDPRINLFRVRAELVAGTTGTVVLSGEVSVDRYSSGVESMMRGLGFDVSRNEIALLPEQGLGPGIYAVSTTAAASLRREPRPRSEQVNTVQLGGCLRLLRTARADDLTSPPDDHWGARDESPSGSVIDEPWYLAQSLEGYLGFVRASQVKRVDGLRLPDGYLSEPTTVTVAGADIRVPAGCYLWKAGDGYVVPLDPPVPLPAKARYVESGTSRLTETQILEIARPLMETRYVWGGVTQNGIDCSGFMQFIHKNLGVYLPRDAEEQSTLGLIVGWGSDAVKRTQPGDLIFFMDRTGRISHVAMSLGGNRIIHSSGRGNGVNVADLGAEEEDSRESLVERILFARRTLMRQE